MKTVYLSVIFFCLLFSLPCQAQLTAVAHVNNATCLNPCSSSAAVVASGGAMPYNYLWAPGNDITASVDSLCAGTYIVKVTDNLGSTVSDTINIIVPSSTDSVSITPLSNTTICSGDSAYICAPSGYTSYHWNNNISDNSPCIYDQYAGNVYVTVTDQNGCTVESNHIGIHVYPNPPISIGSDSTGDTICVHIYDANCVHIKWYLNDSLISDTGFCIIVSAPGHYTFDLNFDSCGPCGAGIILDPYQMDWYYTGILDLKQESISIYPNPLSVGNYQVTVGNSLIGAEMEVFDSEGKIVHRSKINNLKSEIEMNVSPGIYLLHIHSQQYSVVRKLVKL